MECFESDLLLAPLQNSNLPRSGISRVAGPSIKDRPPGLAPEWYSHIIIFSVSSISSHITFVHLINNHNHSAAELLDKYKIPQPLSFFEKVADNEQLQRMTMAKLSRRTTEFTQHEDWLALLTDMNSLRARLFTKVSTDSVQELYLSSLMSSGEFELAQELLHPKRKKTPITLPLATLEKLVIEVSREYFNNAESGKANNPELENALKWYDFLSPFFLSPEIMHTNQSIVFIAWRW